MIRLLTFLLAAPVVNRYVIQVLPNMDPKYKLNPMVMNQARQWHMTTKYSLGIFLPSRPKNMTLIKHTMHPISMKSFAIG